MDPLDDEDLEWCKSNNVKPEKFITDDELAGMCSLLTLKLIFDLKILFGNFLFQHQIVVLMQTF